MVNLLHIGGLVYKKRQIYLISRQNVANFEFCQNVVTHKIPHGDFEKLACMIYTDKPGLEKGINHITTTIIMNATKSSFD
jgi:hypothetical protein